jgi:hypothetical protein
VSSRGIERACQELVTCIALCGDTAPHFTTIAHVVSTLGDDIARVFAAVVAIGDAEGLIGREMFAIDGVKRPSKASKRRSGTRADVERQAAKVEATAQQIPARHRATDALPSEPNLVVKEKKRIERLEWDAEHIREWLRNHPVDWRGPTGGLRQRNRTDNDSARIGTGKGVIQGYTGAAAADAGYHSEANLQALAERAVPALMADVDLRKCDERFATQDRHRAKKEPLHDKSHVEDGRAVPLYQPSDFRYDPIARTCVCVQRGSRCTGKDRTM